MGLGTLFECRPNVDKHFVASFAAQEFHYHGKAVDEDEV